MWKWLDHAWFHVLKFPSVHSQAFHNFVGMSAVTIFILLAIGHMLTLTDHRKGQRTSDTDLWILIGAILLLPLILGGTVIHTRKSWAFTLLCAAIWCVVITALVFHCVAGWPAYALSAFCCLVVFSMTYGDRR